MHTLGMMFLGARLLGCFSCTMREGSDMIGIVVLTGLGFMFGGFFGALCGLLIGVMLYQD